MSGVRSCGGWPSTPAYYNKLTFQHLSRSFSKNKEVHYHQPNMALDYI